MNRSELPAALKSIRTLPDLLRLRAESRPDKTAFVFLRDAETVEGRLTYSELDRRARAVAGFLQDLGAEGERALLLFQPGLDYVASLYGCLYAGVTAVPMYPPRPNRGGDRLRAVVTDARARFALTTSNLTPRVEAALGETTAAKPVVVALDEISLASANDWKTPDLQSDSVAFLQYTSGSTGAPKGVTVTHGNLFENLEFIRRGMEFDEETVFVSWLPPFHDMGLVGSILEPVHVGFEVVHMSPATFLQRPVRWLEAISRFRATASGGPNFAYDLCVRKVTEEQKAGLDLSRWSVAYNGAEPIRATTLEAFAEAFAGCGFRRAAFFPCYGMAETTLMTTGGPKGAGSMTVTVDAEAFGVGAVREGDEGTGIRLASSGKNLYRQTLRIVNPETLRVCSSDEIGEIWVAGGHVASGYWNRPEETEATFRAFTADGEGPFLRTGDLGFPRDGHLFVTGRLKDLVIIRGQNFYPQDIELTAERSHSDFRPGSGAAFSVEVGGEEQLVVVQELEFRRNPDPSELVAAIRRAVAEEHDLECHAVAVIKPGTIPKTSSGKIQRRATKNAFLENTLELVPGDFPGPAAAELLGTDLPETVRTLKEASVTGVEAEFEQCLAEYLVERISRTAGRRVAPADLAAKLITLGFDSLKILEFVGDVVHDFGIELAPADLFDRPVFEVVREAFRRYEPALSATEPSDDEFAEDRTERAPLTRNQLSLWFLQKLAPTNTAYNVPFAFRIHSPVDVGAMRRALQRLTDRHQVLRTTYPTLGDEPTAFIHATHPVFLETTDVTGWDDQTLKIRLFRETHYRFHPGNGPLFRVNLFLNAPGGSILHFNLHHIITDAWSVFLMTEEFLDLYAAETSGGSPEEPAAARPFSAFAFSEKLHLTPEREAEHLSFWRKKLADPPPFLELPVDLQRPPRQTFTGNNHVLRLDETVTRALKTLARKAETTEFSVLLAAYFAWLHCLTRQTDLVVGVPVSGRNAVEFRRTLGYFVNSIPVRVTLAENVEFSKLLKSVSEQVREALVHQEYPFGTLVEKLWAKRAAGRSPIFQTMFALHKYPFGFFERTASLHFRGTKRISRAGLELSAFPLRRRSAQFDLDCTAAEVEGGYEFQIEYASDLFIPKTIVRWGKLLARLMKTVACEPDVRLDAVRLDGDET